MFNAFDFAEPPDWIPYLPIPREKPYKHSVYGDISITPERNANFVTNFTGGVYQMPLPVDAEHKTELSGAVGWIHEMRQNSDGSVDARVEWTDRGKMLIKNDRFKFFSPAWFDEWTDPATETVYIDVAIGGAITTRPFFKNSSLRPLVASEGNLTDETPTNDDEEKQEPPEPVDKGETPMSEPINKDALAFTELQQQFSELKTALTERDAQIEALKASEQAANEQAVKLAERVAAMETAARQKRFSEVAVNWFAPEGSNHIGIMETLADTFGEDSEQFKAYVKQQNAVSEQLAMSDLFRSVGKTGNDGQPKTAAERLEATAKKLQSENSGMTYAQAYAETLQQNPDLYVEYTREGK